MARAGFVVGFVTGAAVMIFGFAALGLHADEPSRDVHEAAAVAGYDEVELGAALTTLSHAGLPSDPWTYARFEGRLPPLEKASPPIADKWLRLVQCEASGDWHNARNPRYFGGLQFDAPTWARYGGLTFAPRADFATPAQQVLVAERTLAVQGWAAWPRCSRMLGFR
jgi:Transglycosylase-like domain